jgi:hypothetical protein
MAFPERKVCVSKACRVILPPCHELSGREEKIAKFVHVRGITLEHHGYVLTLNNAKLVLFVKAGGYQTGKSSWKKDVGDLKYHAGMIIIF